MIYNFFSGSKDIDTISFENLKADDSPPCICTSVLKKVSELKTKHADCLIKTSTIITEPYHFLTENSHHQSVSKLSLPLYFYELIEIIKTIHLILFIKGCEINQMLFVDKNPEQIKQFVSLYIPHAEEKLSCSISIPPYKMIFIDNATRHDYLNIVKMAITQQATNGMLIIKTSDLYYKQSIAFLHALNAMYGQVLGFRPSISSSITGDIFLICKYKRPCPCIPENNLKTTEEKNKLNCLLFLSKVEDFVIYFGKKQLENLLSNMDALTSEKIFPKTLQWCKMLQIPLK